MKTLLYTLILLVAHCSSANSQTLEPCRGDSGLYGYCDGNGQMIIDYQYYDALEFVDGHAAVLKEDKWGIINESGHWMVKPAYDEVVNCVNVPGQILVREEDNWFFVNSYGIQMTHEFEVRSPWHEFDLEGTEAYFSEDTWFAVIRKGKWGVIDVHDQVKMSFNYQWTRVVRREIAGRQGVVALIMKERDKYAWQRVDATAATGFDFDQYLGEYENYLFFMEGAKPVILNAISGERVFQTSREYFNLIDDEDSVGLVNSAGKIIVPFRYQYVDIGSIDGFALFGSRSSKGLSALNGKVLLKDVYKDIKLVAPTTLAVKNQEGKVALIAIQSAGIRNVTSFKYDYAVKDGDRIRMKMGSKLGYVTSTGVETWKN